MADAAPDDDEKARMKRALDVLEPLRRRISVLLLLPEASPGTARVTARYLLKFIDMELSVILAALRGPLVLKEQGADRIVREQDEWLLQIRNLPRLIGVLLDRYERPPPHAAAVLLYRAARCCWLTCCCCRCRCRCCPKEEPECLFGRFNWRLGFCAQHPLMYKHLLLVGDDGDDTASTSSRTYRRLSYWSMLLSLYIASMFPLGYKFDKNSVIWKWASEGLTSAADGWAGDNYSLIWKWASEGLIEVADWWGGSVSGAEVYFSELVDREVIIQAANYGHKPAAEAEDCRWHVNPDMLQFLASESADKGFFCTSGMLNSAAGGDSDSTEILRRLSLHQPDPELPTLLETMDLSHTRSLSVSGAVDRIPLRKFIYLTVLDLEGWENLKDEDLRQQICSTMFVLRYLSVRNTGVIRLPPEIKELSCLKALDVSNTKITELPPEIKELHYLEALDVSHTQISELPPEACKLHWLQALDLRSTQVRQLPEQIVKLRVLRDLLVGGDEINPDETVAKVPEGIVRCANLRTLATVDLSKWSASSVEALGVREDLKVLAITWSFHQCADGRYQEALRSSIEKLKNLNSLTIHCGLGCSMEFLGSLDSPPKKLEKFKVTTGRIVTVPQWIRGLEHLSFLQITVCKLGTDDLKILGELPKLQRLVLGLDFLPGEAIVIRSEGFSQLRTFSVHCLVPWLTFGGGAMPQLTYLDLEIICSVPPNQEIVLSGISNLEKLREVALRYSECYSDSSSVKKTVEVLKIAVAEHPNPIELVINGTQHGVQAEAVDVEMVRTPTQIQRETEIEDEIENEAQMP